VAELELVEDLTGAEQLERAWDELALAAALPLCAPGWMLSWWRHLAPPGELRVMAVREAGELLALAPWFAQRGGAGRLDLRFLGVEHSDRVDVLCRPGREREAAELLRRGVLGARPRADLVSFEAVPAGSRWPGLLRGGGGRLRLARYVNSVIPAPTVGLPSGEQAFAAWMASRSPNFRSQMGRMGRRLEARGGRVRALTGAAERERGIDALLAMHAARWEGRARSHLLRPGVRGLLLEAAAALGPERLRLWTAEIEGEPISVQLFLAAGGEVKYWNGGWQERHADLKPTMLTILAALRDGIERGERRLDLGAGTHSYKLRFADGSDPLCWGGLIVRNARWPRTRMELAPRVLRHRARRAVRALPEPLAGRLEAAVRERRRGPG